MADVPTPPAFATRGVSTVAAVVLFLHGAAALFGTKHWFDEVYMLAVGRNHLDWGSADQPPLTPALASLADAIAPGSNLLLRVPAMLATSAAVVVAALIARELGCDGRAQVFTAAAQATGIFGTLTGHWLTPYALEPVQWLLLAWLLIRWQRVRDDRLLLALGLVTGLAAMTKFQVMGLAVVLLVAILAVGPRDVLKRPSLWFGAVLAVLIAAPTLLWQQAHGWPQLAMTSVVAGEAEALYGGRSGIAVQLLISAGVAGVVLVGYGGWRLCTEPELRPYRYLGIAFVVLYVSFVVTAGRPYYLGGLYAPLVAAGALGLQRRREAGRAPRRWLVWPAWSITAAVALATLTLSVVMTRSELSEEIARRTAEAYRALPEAQRSRTAIIGESYVLAAFLDGASRQLDIPPAYGYNRSYGYFPPPPADHDVVLYLGRTPDRLRPYFDAARRVGDIGDDLHLFVLTGQREPWTSSWPRLRTLTVS